MFVGDLAHFPMNVPNLLRSLSSFVLASCALVASAQTAYSNTSGTYLSGAGASSGNSLQPAQSIAFQFTSGLTGVLGGFRVAINDLNTSSGSAFTLRLYTSTASNTLGTLLGTYAGTSTGLAASSTSTAFASVAAIGAPVALTSGTSYWLAASTMSNLIWNYTDGTTTQSGAYTMTTSTATSAYQYASFKASAFSVQAVPEPTTLAALGLGAVGVLRRRRKA